MASALHAHDLRRANRCVSGDEAAQREFFRREFRHVHATLYRVLGSNTDMDDLVQDAFFEIFRSLPTFRGESSLSTWLDRVTVRVAYGYMSRRVPPATRLELVPDIRSGAPSAEERVQMREVARHLYSLLDRLEPKKRIAFTLHVVDGRPIRDVAAVMDCTPLLVKVRVWRAWQFVEKHASKDAALASFFRSTPEKRP